MFDCKVESSRLSRPCLTVRQHRAREPSQHLIQNLNNDLRVDELLGRFRPKNLVERKGARVTRRCRGRRTLLPNFAPERPRRGKDDG